MSETNQAETPAIVATNVPEVKVPDGTQATEQEAAATPAAPPESVVSERPKGVQKRLDELTRNWREEQRRNDALMDLLRKQQAPEIPPAIAKTLADFEYDESKYQSYLFGEAERRAVSTARREIEEQSRRETEARRRQSFATREAEFAKTVEDYRDVVYDDSLPISAAMAEAIAESDDGPALAYHLGKNLETAQRIAGLSPLAAARELGRIEARLATEREKAKGTVVSKAPPPAPKIEAVEPAVSKDPTQMTDAEFAKWRRRQIDQRR